MNSNPPLMRLRDRNAWDVKDAPSTVQGVDLRKNRAETKPLRALDGMVGAYFEMERTTHFVTTHARYVPLLPQIDPDCIVLRRDMRYGHDDPVLWPQLYSSTFCHLAAIPRPPLYGQAKLSIMFWNPTPQDFVCPASGLTLTRGLGRLSAHRYLELHRLANELIDEYERYLQSLPSRTPPSPLFPQLVQALRLSLERLTIPATYIRMQLGVVAVQREYLELTGLLRYMAKYKPRMEGREDAEANPSQPDNCVGCYTDDPHVAQIFWKACLPCWLIRPLRAFADENILRVVVPFPATDFLEMDPAEGFSPVKTTDRVDYRLRALHKCTRNTPWYRNPLLTGTPSTSTGNSRASQQSSAPSPSATRANPRAGSNPYAAARAQLKAQKEASGPNPNAKAARDKFLPFDRLEMPATITIWATALAGIDRSRPPSCGADLPQRYVMPEPALVVAPEDEIRRRVYYHHYRLMRDALMFRLADPSVPPALLSAQEWRDVLQGKVTKQGKTGTQAQLRSATVEDLLRPAFKACGIDALTEFPVQPDAVPPIHLNSARELIWELAEINFRYEFLALDARASGLDRPDECRKCFAGDGLVGLDFRESQRGLGSLRLMDRLPYVLCMANLMRVWLVPCQRPKEIDSAEQRLVWDDEEARQLESKVAIFYTQSFYEIFGRAAIIPMRLEHEIGA